MLQEDKRKMPYCYGIKKEYDNGTSGIGSQTCKKCGFKYECEKQFTHYETRKIHELREVTI